MVRSRNPPVEFGALEQAAQCLRTLSHPHRLKIVELLMRRDCTVGEMAEACGIQSHMASEHLRRMKDRGLLASRRDGRRTYYRIADDGLRGIMNCIAERFGGAEIRRRSKVAADSKDPGDAARS